MTKLLRLKLVGAFTAGVAGAGLSTSLVKLNLERTEKENDLVDIRKSLEELQSGLANIPDRVIERAREEKEKYKIEEEKENSKSDEASEKRRVVCVINMQGFIGNTGPINMQCYRQVIDETFQNENLQEVILNVNSWGGSLIQACFSTLSNIIML